MPTKISLTDCIVRFTPEPECENPEKCFDLPEAVAHVRHLAEFSEWGWCVVRCTVELKAKACVQFADPLSDDDYAQLCELVGTDYLGECSYESEEDFRAGGYAEDMVTQALDDLLRKMESLGLDVE